MDMEDKNGILNKIWEMEAESVANQQREKTFDEKSIQYYVSSAIEHPENVQELSRNEPQIAYENIYRKLQNGQKISRDEENFLIENDAISYEKAKSIEHETESLMQEFQKCGAKQEVRGVKSSHLNRIRSWYKLIENDSTIPFVNKIEYTLFKDAKVSAIRNVFEKFIESAEYKNLPAETENSAVGDMSLTSMEVELSEEREAKCIRAKMGYENFFKRLNEQEAFDNGKSSSFDKKG